MQDMDDFIFGDEEPRERLFFFCAPRMGTGCMLDQDRGRILSNVARSFQMYPRQFENAWSMVVENMFKASG